MYNITSCKILCYSHTWQEFTRVFKTSLRPWNEMLTHWISMPFDRLSSLSKSSLFITLPPELVLQPFVFQLSTQLVIPVQREHYHKTCYQRSQQGSQCSEQPFNRSFNTLTPKSQAKTSNTEDTVWFPDSVFQDCIFPLLLQLLTNVFPNRYLKTTTLHTHYTHNCDVNFNKLKLRICLTVQ